jgi:predicted HAD superfamily Cof-like phosphohydrolase
MFMTPLEYINSLNPARQVVIDNLTDPVERLSTAVSTAQQAVRDFHDKFGLPVGITPEVLEGTEALRLELIDEEVEELYDAVNNGDLPEVADALGDILYVVLGAAVSWGIDLGPIFAEIHKTNMAKEGGKVRWDGKILKPDGWKPPEILRLLKEQGYED